MVYPQKFVVIVAYSGSGKTYMGDYLALYHDFAHIDGDMPLHDPQHAHVAKTFGQTFKKYWFSGEEAPEAADWQPVYKILCDQAKAAAETADRVVITQSAYRREARAYIRQELGPDDVLFVQLDVDMDVLITGLFEREAKIFPSYFGRSLEDCWKEGRTPLEEAVEKWGEFGFDSFKKYKQATNIRGYVPVGEDEGQFCVLDGSARDKSVLDGLCKLLGLTCVAEVDSTKINGAQKIRLDAFKKDRLELFAKRGEDETKKMKLN
jgi:gluconate kinase